MTAPYADALAQYAARDDRVRLYVPGHGADAQAAPALAEYFGAELLRHDVTPLLSGLDKGPGNALDEAQRLAARAWGAKRTWFLTNGASQANRMAAIALGSLRAADEPVLAQRSAHSSFIDGIILAGLVPAFVSPTIDPVLGINHGVSPAALRDAIERGETRPKAVYLISPSYFGAVADVAALAEAAHAVGAPLIVDAAWGAHFGFHPDLPENPLALGADLVVSSTHKLAGSLTQSAMLHLGDGPFAAELEPLLERAFALTQSTSTSALLLASLDLARDSIEHGEARTGASIEAADRLREEVRARGRFGIVSDGFGRFDDIVAVDPLRVSIDVGAAGLNGHEVRERLEHEGVSFEISTDSAIVAVLGAGAVPDVDRVVAALHALPVVEPAAGDALVERAGALALPAPGPLVMRPRDAFLAPGEAVPIEQAIGRVSTDSLAAYPPGIPNVLPGERITAEVVAFLRRIAAMPGGHVRGAADPALSVLRVVRADHGQPDAARDTDAALDAALDADRELALS